MRMSKFGREKDVFPSMQRVPFMIAVAMTLLNAMKQAKVERFRTAFDVHFSIVALLGVPALTRFRIAFANTPGHRVVTGRNRQNAAVG